MGFWRLGLNVVERGFVCLVNPTCWLFVMLFVCLVEFCVNSGYLRHGLFCFCLMLLVWLIWICWCLVWNLCWYLLFCLDRFDCWVLLLCDLFWFGFCWIVGMLVLVLVILVCGLVCLVGWLVLLIGWVYYSLLLN